MANKDVTPPIGIHLETIFSCVGVWDQRIEIIPSHIGDKTTPSFVAFTPSECLIGEGAKNQVTRNAANTIYDVHRLVGRRFNDPEVQEGIKGWPFKVIKGSYGLPRIVVAYKGKEKEYSPEEITSMVLAELKKYAELYLSTTVKDAVITVPAYFNDSQRQATKVAANLAGLDVLQIISEPSAAAIAYGLDNGTDEKNVIIFHLDADTFNVSLVTVNNGTLVVKAMSGDSHFGGQDIVNIMVDHFVKEFNIKHKMDLSGNLKALGRLRIQSEKAIQDFSSVTETNISVDNLHEGIDFFTTCTRNKFQYINRSFFNKCIETVTSCLRDAKMNKTDVDDIVLVGVTNRIPKVEQLLREFFNGKEICKSIQPEEVIAYGATILATKTGLVKSKKAKSLPLRDIVPLSLGVDAYDGIFSVIIPRNTPIPAEKENIYFTTRDSQNSISFNVYQGDRSRAKDNNWLGKFEVAVSPAPKGKSKVRVVFSVDADGTFNCWIKEFTTGLKRKILIDNDKVKRSEEEIERMVHDAERNKLDDQEYKKIMCARNVLEEYIYNVKKKMKTIGSTDKTRLHAEEIKKMEHAIQAANQYLDVNPELADVDEYENVLNQLEKLCVSVIAQLV